MRGGQYVNNWRMAELHAKEAPARVHELEHFTFVPVDFGNRDFVGETLVSGEHGENGFGDAVWGVLPLAQEARQAFARYLLIPRIHRATAALEPLAASYADAVAWQESATQGARGRELEAYWCRRLAGAPCLLEMPTDFPRPARETFAGAVESLTLDSQVAANLRAIARSVQATLFNVLLTVVANVSPYITHMCSLTAVKLVALLELSFQHDELAAHVTEPSLEGLVVEAKLGGRHILP